MTALPESALLGNRFIDYTLKNRAEYIIRRGYRTVRKEMVCEDMTAFGIKTFLVEANRVAELDHCYAEFVAEPVDYGDSAVLKAVWRYEIPYSEEETQEAKDYLDSLPKESPSPIKWRKPIPFKINDPLDF